MQLATEEQQKHKQQQQQKKHIPNFLVFFFSLRLSFFSQDHF